jgi:acetyltransferase-like isoleucine patch superfamily enzyme
MSAPTSKLQSAMERPGDAFRYVMARLKGGYYQVLFRLLGRRFSAGRRLRVYGRLNVRGPGRVIFGDDVVVWGVVTPWTHSTDAVIRVGDRTSLSQTRMGCVSSITIGRNGIVADCRILDSDFHSIAVNRRDQSAPIRTLPITIGDNVWIASQVGILPGTTIGENSVVSFGAICSGTFPANIVVAGNPARIAGRIPGVETAASSGPRVASGETTGTGVMAPVGYEAPGALGKTVGSGS